MRYFYENVDWNEVKNAYVDFKSVYGIAKKFNIGQTTLKRFLESEGVYDPIHKRKEPVNKTKFKIGDKFHRWTIIGDYELEGRRYVVPVICECGTISKTRLNWLIDGKTTGCRSCSLKINYPSKRRLSKRFIHVNGLSNSWLNSIKNNSVRGFLEQRVLEISITLNDLYNKLVEQNFKCALTGEDLNVLDVKRSKSNGSVDRISSDKGYTIDNIQWILKDVNRMKNEFNQEYFINICNKISKFKQDNPDPSVNLND